MAGVSTGEPWTGGDPIALSPATYERHAAAVDYIERQNRITYTRSKRGRTTSPSAGVWGFLPPGNVITSMHPGTLGEGDMVLCSRDGADLLADGDEVHVYNAGRPVKAGSSGLFFPLHWMDGVWMPIIPPFAVGKAVANIPPRSGTTFGVGEVDIYESSGAYGYGYGYGHGDTAEGPLNRVEVLNASSSTFSTGVSISSGIWCSVAWDQGNTAWVSPLECPA